jgi:hypothetical protein
MLLTDLGSDSSNSVFQGACARPYSLEEQGRSSYTILPTLCSAWPEYSWRVACN